MSKSWQSLSWASAKVRFYNFHFSHNKLLNYLCLIIITIITIMIFISKTYIQDAEAVERTGRSRRALIIAKVTWLLRIRQSQMPPLSEVSFLESLSFLQAHFLATLHSLWLPSPPVNPGSPLPPSSPNPPSSSITQPAPIFNQHRDFRNYPLMMSPPSLTIFCRNSNLQHQLQLLLSVFPIIKESLFHEMLPVWSRLKYWRLPCAATARSALPICRSCICVLTNFVLLCFLDLVFSALPIFRSCICVLTNFVLLCFLDLVFAPLCLSVGPVFVF